MWRSKFTIWRIWTVLQLWRVEEGAGGCRDASVLFATEAAEFIEVRHVAAVSWAELKRAEVCR